MVDMAAICLPVDAAFFHQIVKGTDDVDQLAATDVQVPLGGLDVEMP